MQRIMIVGQPGAGKSTLACDLGAITGLPVFHVDHIHWQPGWVARPSTEKTVLCHAVEAGEAWIFEGGHSATWDNRLARADLMIWLDLPVGLRFWRVVLRTVRYQGQVRPDLPEGCREGFHRETLPFWHYIWHTRRSARNRIAAMVANAGPEKRVLRLTSSRAVRDFLRTCRTG